VSIKVNYALVCDSIRQEDNGKLIFVGVYTGDILISRYPADLTLQVWLEMLPEVGGDPEDFSVRIRQGPDDGLVLGELEATVERIDPDQPVGPTQVSLPPIPFHVERPSEFIVELKAGEGDWMPVLRKQVYCLPKQATPS
jgi:hypothetical protein